MTNPKIIVRTGFKLSLSNIDRGNKNLNLDKRYVNGILNYFTDDKKRVLNMLDYFTGKINKNEEINLVKENGQYATKKEMEQRKKYISKKFNESNIWQIVLSVDKKLVDDNISWRDLEIKLAKEIIPKTLKKMGFEDITKMNYQFSLHTNTKHPHFHISFMEKSPNTRNQKNELMYMRRGKIPNSVIKYLKNETVLTIEINSKFKPMSLDINNEIEEFKKYFDPKCRNYVLYDKSNILLEDKILTLGKLLNEKEISYNSKIKFNSIKDKEIKDLTRNIKKEIFKVNKDIQLPLSYFTKSLKIMNDYLIRVSKNNNIKLSDIDLSYTKNKEKYLENYILNSIVNHARNNYKKGIKDLSITSNDVIQMIILKNYKNNKGYSKKDIIKSSLNNKGVNKYQNKRDIINAVKSINREMEEAANEFEKLFRSDTYEK